MRHLPSNLFAFDDWTCNLNRGGYSLPSLHNSTTPSTNVDRKWRFAHENTRGELTSLHDASLYIALDDSVERQRRGPSPGFPRRRESDAESESPSLLPAKGRNSRPS